MLCALGGNLSASRMCAFMQAEKEAGPPGEDEERGQWFSNPSANHGTAAVRAGVGKYIPKTVLPLAAAGDAGNSGGGGKGGGGGSVEGQPVAKKRKAGNGYGNFDAW